MRHTKCIVQFIRVILKGRLHCGDGVVSMRTGEGVTEDADDADVRKQILNKLVEKYIF